MEESSSDVSHPSVQRGDCGYIDSISEESGIVLEYSNTYSNERAPERESSEYIRSWAGVTRGIDIMETPKRYPLWGSGSPLKFEIVSARTIVTDNQKYVAYTMMVTLATEDDPYPAILERRYTEFLNLYTRVKREFPGCLNKVQFPKKEMVGNFSPETISRRSKSFELFFQTIQADARLRNCAAVTDFLQRRELTQALKLIKLDDYDFAVTLVENCFRLMNKLQTDRSIVVLQNLCLLICVQNKLNGSSALDLACLAVRRFQGVSDADILRYYVPLLNISLELATKYGKSTAMLSLEERLIDLRTRGIALHDSTPLLTLLLDDISSIYPLGPPECWSIYRTP